jgi:hypothetical protein
MKTLIYMKELDGTTKQVHDWTASSGFVNIRIRQNWYSMPCDCELWEFNPDTLAVTLVQEKRV